MSSVYIVCRNFQMQEMFLEAGWTVVDNIADADLIQFTGGADVSPILYGESPHPKTSNFFKRDIDETHIFDEARKLGKPMSGICRGGQFLHVLSGGKLFQHIEGHAITGTHLAYEPNGDALEVTSTHHQAMRYMGEGKILLVAKPHGLQECVDEDGNVVGIEVIDSMESIYHDTTKAFCFQPHPELSNGMECRGFYFRKLFDLFGLGNY